MESLGYIITNRFILVAVDSNLELTAGKQQIQIPNAKKVFKTSDSTMVSVIGLPDKVSNIYKYLDKLEGKNKSFQETIDDLESIFNTDQDITLDEITKVSTSIPNFLNSNGEVMENEIKEHFKDSPELLSILEESLRMVKTGGGLGNKILVFTGENKTNLFGQYINIGFNMIGGCSSPLKEDYFNFDLVSAKKQQIEVNKIIQSSMTELQSSISVGWERVPEQVDSFKEKAQDILEKSLKMLCPFDMEPNIVFYELSDTTSNTFKDPELKLLTININ